MYKEIMNSVSLVGNISFIGDIKESTTGKKYLYFDICQNSNYIDKTGEKKDIKEFYSIKLNEKEIEKYKDIIKVGNWIHIIGFLHTYLDKNNNRKTFIVSNNIRDLNKEIQNKELFDYDWLNDSESEDYEV